MERPKYKSIDFDMDTKAMKKIGKYPNGYRELGKALHEWGFMRNQGSNYVSKEKLLKEQVNDMVISITRQHPWLETCTRSLDVSNVDKKHNNLIGIMKGALSNDSKNYDVKKDKNKGNTLEEQFKQSPTYKSNVERFGQKTADKMLSESLKNMSTQEKNGRWLSAKKPTSKVHQNNSAKNSYAKGK